MSGLASALDGLRDTLEPSKPENAAMSLMDIAKRLGASNDVAKHTTADRVALADLHIDTGTQRPIDRDKVESMRAAKAYRDPIRVNQRPDGSLWLMNGQHRAQAAHEDGLTHVHARIEFHDRETERQITADGAGTPLLKTSETPDDLLVLKRLVAA
jgi:hypothetical protein